MIVIDSQAIKSNTHVIEKMCRVIAEIIDNTEGNVDAGTMINLCNQVLSAAHWLIQSGFTNVPDPEPLQEITGE